MLWCWVYGDWRRSVWDRYTAVRGSCVGAGVFLDCVLRFIGQHAVLDISELPLKPQADDWAFVFQGRNTITSLRGAPGLPWRVSEIDVRWEAHLTTAIPIGHWQGKGAWALSVPEDSISATEQLAGNLYSLLGRVDDAIFHAHGRVSITSLAGYPPLLRSLRQRY